MEHAVYLCAWSRSRDGYSLWVTSRPKLRANGSTHAEAEERLIRAIQDAGGATHAVLEFDPPLPKSILEAKYAKPEIYLICGDDRFETNVAKGSPFESAAELEERLKGIDAFFQSPICRKCKYSSSPRSDEPLSLSYAPARYDGAFGHVGKLGMTTLQLFSGEFLDLLTPQERQYLKLRPVIRKRPARKFYELLGPAGPPLVAVAGLKISGWRCSKCGHRIWGYWVEGLSIRTFIAASDLPPFLRGIFTVGIPPEIHLAVTSERWKALVGQKGTRGFTSNLLGVVPEHEVVRVPELPTYEESLRGAGCLKRSV
ncbi:MAG TPA: hypothetical protein VNV43_13475 [Candidatus Acidoferrales bacterium]|nr:hypothetical protein [Candidatus Acidoferrales bacterium]